MNFRTQLALLSSTCSALFAVSAEARDCTIAQTVFTDGLYGMGAGLIVGALWMTANAQNTEGSDVVPTLATGALIGGGVGAVLGIVEVGLCINDRKSAPAQSKAGLQIPAPAILFAKNSSAVSSKNALNPTNAAMGFNVKYVLE